jgi:hypothetical protein
MEYLFMYGACMNLQQFGSHKQQRNNQAMFLQNEKEKTRRAKSKEKFRSSLSFFFFSFLSDLPSQGGALSFCVSFVCGVFAASQASLHLSIFYSCCCCCSIDFVVPCTSPSFGRRAVEVSLLILSSVSLSFRSFSFFPPPGTYRTSHPQ